MKELTLVQKTMQSLISAYAMRIVTTVEVIIPTSGRTLDIAIRELYVAGVITPEFNKWFSELVNEMFRMELSQPEVDKWLERVMIIS